MLPGIIIKPLKRLYYKRVSFTEIVRRDQQARGNYDQEIIA